jgi:hypothetical protein
MSHFLRASLDEHYVLCKTHARRLAKDGEVERALKELGQWDKKDQERFEEERRKVMHLALISDERLRLLEEFAGLEKKANCEQEALEEIWRKIDDSSVPPKSGGEYETEIRSTLGMPKTTETSNEKNDDEEDEELAVVGRPSDGGLKCPLTCKFLEDPVKNKVCGHAYSKAAIQAHLAICKDCPVAGCGNRHVQMSDLKADVELTQLVRRQKRREDAEKEQRKYSQVLEEELDDDEVQVNQQIPGRRKSTRRSTKTENY